jgi:selenide,water dikinase
MTNAAARAGDLLVLTKPLGTGVATTGIKRGIASAALEKKVTTLMARLNTPGADVAEAGLVKAATDVTGFGLLGHLASMCRASGTSAELDAAAVPAIADEVWRLIEQDCVPGGTRANLQACEGCVEWGGTPAATRVLLADAQTSGGLLLCVAPKKLDAVLAILKRHRTPIARVIGRITKRGPVLIRVR